jgi:dipeptidyl aminopeptidase/acylaminoacyl peptidase
MKHARKNGGRSVLRWIGPAPLGMLFVGVVVLVAPALALATENGRIAYQMSLGTVENPDGRQQRAIFVTGSGQLTFPPPGTTDFNPVWSPDGEQLAFTRLSDYRFTGDSVRDYLIAIVGKDGAGFRPLVSSDAFGESAVIRSPTWSGDGERIAFVVHNPARTTDYGIWIIRADGSGLTQIVQEYHEQGINQVDPFPDKPAWSPAANEIAYVCWFRTGPNLGLRPDLCIVDVTTRVRRTVAIDGPPGSAMGQIVVSSASAGTGGAGPNWSPDGEKLIFIVRYIDSQNVSHGEIFTVNRDGTGLTQVTNSPIKVCSVRPDQKVPAASYSSAAYSPDGEWIVTQAGRPLLIPVDIEGSNDFCVGAERGLWTLSSSGGPASLLVAALPDPTNASNPALQNPEQPDWQPALTALIVKLDDGHGNPLQGAKVELRNPDGTPVDASPINTVGGTYVFENDITPGEYVLRATLVDNAGASGSPPAFDIRYRETATEPVWIEKRFTQADSNLLPISFAGSDLAASNVFSPDRLDDLANIYFRVRQYADWVEMHLTTAAIPTVSFYTFATSRPWDNSSAVGPHAAFYSAANSAIVLGTTESAYENRDGIGSLEYDENFNLIAGHFDGAPENSEWHEFTHHLYRTFITSSPCTVGSTNHGGYNNPDTCDSMSEGFATFLPTLAAQDITGASDADYDSLGYNLDLVKYKAWGYREDLEEVFRPTLEDVAVAGLFWDLVDFQADIEPTQVIGTDGLHHPAIYTDLVNIPLRQLWNQLTSSHPVTVFDLRVSFGQPALTVDLDGNGTLDVAPLDQVFLMHGFFPIDGDQTITDSHKTYHYDVAYAPGAPNNAVGTSFHNVYDASGALTASLIPRYNTPVQPHANLAIDVRDTSGNPLSGATLDIAIRYPGNREGTVRRLLGTGDGALVHLELPPYFDYLLPTGAPLPACDPANDFRVQVTLSATVNGAVSSDTPSFDNCTYQRAMAAATSPAALSFTLRVPAQGGGSPEVCDGIDNDLDGQIDEALGTLSCGVGACARTVNACEVGVPQACTPGAPGAEICGDGVDNDCDGLLDNGCPAPPVFQFSGFFPPVDNTPMLNVVRAGRAIPVKFSLHGNQGLDIFAAGFPTSGPMACDETAPVEAIEATATAGNSGLTYDATTDQYTYVWKTDRAWAGQCRQLTVTLTDGSSYMARFKFTE